MGNSWNEKSLRVHLQNHVNLVTSGKKRLGAIWIIEKYKSGEWYIDLHGRAGWFSSSDPEMDMDIYPSDIEQIKGFNKSITIFLKKSKFNSVEVIFKNHEDKYKCYELISNMIVNYKERKKGRFIMDMSSIDYSTIDNKIKEELADRVAMIVLTLENIAHVFDGPENALKDLLEVRRELIQLVNDLGGHPAVS